MDEIRTSIDKIFDQFTMPGNNSTTIPKRLSYSSPDSAEPASNPKKRKFSYERSDISHKLNDSNVKDTASFNLNDSNVSLNSSLSVPPSPWEHRRLKADLIESQALVVHLKKEIENRTTMQTQLENLYSDKVSGLQRQLDRSTSKVSELEKHLRLLRRRQAAEKDELTKVKNQLNQQKQAFEEQIGSMHKTNQELEHNLRKTKYELGSTNAALQEQLKQIETTYELTRDELEILQDAHDLMQEKARKFAETELKLEETKLENESLERKIATLESQVTEFGEWKDLSKTFHSRLAKMPDLEKELERLKRDNKNIYDTIGHKLLLEEEVSDLRSRLEKSERNNVDGITLKTQLQAIEKELNQYKSIAKDHCSTDKPISSIALRQRIEEILQRDIILANEKHSVKNEKNSISNQIQELKRDLEIYQKANGDLQTSLKYHKSSLNRVQKKLMLVAKERDCYRQLTENYEKDLTISSAQSELAPDTQLKLRVEMLEKTIAGYKEMCAGLERDIQSAKALPDLGIDSVTTSETYSMLKNELDGLRAENERLRRRKDELELTLEQMSMKGAYNIDKYKILHLKMNPADEAFENHKQDIAKLQAEIERLKRKNRKLEEDQEELTARLNDTINNTVNLQENATLRNQIKTLETKNQHLREVYKKGGQELREACYLMFGYRLDRIDNNNYKISSMYAESEQDYLHFRIDDGCLNMLETELSKTLDYITETYLGKFQSVPAFLGMLQVELFNRTTVA